LYLQSRAIKQDSTEGIVMWLTPLAM